MIDSLADLFKFFFLFHLFWSFLHCTCLTDMFTYLLDIIWPLYNQLPFGFLQLCLNELKEDDLKWFFDSFRRISLSGEVIYYNVIW